MADDIEKLVERWAQPGDKPHRVWVIMYEDADRAMAYFDGPDAEELAREQYERSWPSWNCYLFATQPHEPEAASRISTLEAELAKRDEALAAERENCAKVADSLEADYERSSQEAYSNEIRAHRLHRASGVHHLASILREPKAYAERLASVEPKP